MIPYATNFKYKLTVYIFVVILAVLIKEGIDNFDFRNLPHVGQYYDTVRSYVQNILGGFISGGALKISTLALILFVIFDKFLWRLLGKIVFTYIPNFNGTWIGQIEERRHQNSQIIEEKDTLIPVKLVIRQTFTKISISFESQKEITIGKNRISEAVSASIFNDEGSTKLIYVFKKEGKKGISEILYDHRGTLFGAGRRVISGEYISDAPRVGSYKLYPKQKYRFLHLGEIRRVQSSNGRAYLAVDILAKDVYWHRFLFRLLVGQKKADLYEKNKFKRDHDRFHVTVVSPDEMDLVDENYFIGRRVWLDIRRLASQSLDGNECYYITVESEIINKLRQKSELVYKNLHITLGFNIDDVHDAAKDRTTEISPFSRPLIFARVFVNKTLSRWIEKIYN